MKITSTIRKGSNMTLKEYAKAFPSVTDIKTALRELHQDGLLEAVADGRLLTGAEIESDLSDHADLFVFYPEDPRHAQLLRRFQA